MLKAFTAALIVVSFAVVPVDAATSKKGARQTQGAQSQRTTSMTTTPPSLIWDRRVLGRPRTCGFDYMQYDGYGVPTGPYCH
jgi:hypothetical protein